MTATIKDVAKVAGVSISTVSRVVNESKPVSPEVKKKVLKAIEELGYRPNEVARTLVTKKSFIIGVIVTDIGNSYIAEIVRGIEEVGKIYGYDILLCSTFGDKETELRYMQMLSTKQVEGIILISNEINQEIDRYTEKRRFPFIYLNRYFVDERFMTVKIDNKKAAFEMTKYLLNMGHSRITYISNTDTEKALEYVKISGYKEALKTENLESSIFITEGIDEKSGYEVAEKVIENGSTAIFCGYDEIAIGVLGYCYDNNIKVPEDISIVGFGDIKVASIYRPTLTTVKVPYYDIGAVSIRKIIKELNGESSDSEDIVLPYKVIERSSSKSKKG